MNSYFERGGPYALALFTIGALAATACEDDSVRMRLLVYDKATDDYAIRAVDIETINDIERLDGEVTVLKGGLSVEIDYQTGKMSWKELGHSVVFSAFDQNGVLVPENYDSLAMATVYYNMERSYLFFRDTLGIDGALLKRLSTYYKPRVVTISQDGEKLLEQDNAFYMKIEGDEQAFFIINHNIFQWIPMSLNGGIITHEYSHYIFNTLVLEKKGGLDPESDNFLLAINEGSADFFATARTADPRFMSHSIPKGYFAVPCNSLIDYMELSRDIANPEQRDYTRVMDQWARSTTPVDFCPYKIGLVWAAMLYEIATAIGPADAETPSRAGLVRVAKWLVATLDDLGKQLAGQETFEIWEVMSILVAQIDSTEERKKICDIIEERYNLYFDEVDGC